MNRPRHKRARARRHLLRPAVAGGIVAASALATLPSAASALSSPDIGAMSAVPTTALAATAVEAARSDEPDQRSTSAGSQAILDARLRDRTSRTAPQRVVRGVALEAKPPPPPPPPPWQLPVSGYELTGRFGASSSLWSSTHTGLDLAAPEGTEIRSIGPGVVTEVGSDGAFGNKTVIRLADGTELWYCHQSSMSVAVGQRVAAGQAIGAVGSTGNVTGAHLHLEVHQGETPVDPEAWLAEHGLRP